MATTKREPAQRRQQIVSAAAEMLRAGEPKLTHRRVAERAGVPLASTTYYFASLDELSAAAVQLLADEVDAGLAETADTLAAGDGSPEAVARFLHEYLTDRDRVRTEIALSVAGLSRPPLAGLARRWFDGLVDLLTPLTDRRTATQLAVFADGACLHAALEEQPLELALLEDLTRTLMA